MKSIQAEEPERVLVVSIHDVSPKTRERTDEILEALGKARVRECSLLIVPDHHGTAPFTEDAAFRTWLHRQVAAGHELVLHGYTHQRKRRRKEGLLKKLVTRIYTADEGEFHDISEESALAKLTRAQSEFRELGINPRGFIAPAWLLGKAAEAAVRHTGFDYTTRLGTVSDYRSNRIHRSQSLVWSVRSPLRIRTSLRWNEVLFERLKHNPLMRIGIHPPDFDHRDVRNQIMGFVKRATRDRIPTTYSQWLDGMRAELASPAKPAAQA